MTTPQAREAAANILMGEVTKNAQQLFYLKDRWRDEREYEDWQDYVDAAAKLFDNTMFELDGMDKRFEMDFTAALHPGYVFTVKFGTRTTLSWRTKQ